jgi:AAA15 family ATPase/GTPase
MFTKFTLKNYRTHLDSTIELKDITLLIGGNNSGKSNLLAGIQHFARLIGHAWEHSGQSNQVESRHYFPHKHSLDTANQPMIFACEWQNQLGKVAYHLELYCLSNHEMGCKEKIEIAPGSSNETVQQEHGYQEVSDKICLQTKLRNVNLTDTQSRLANDFFHTLATARYYNFQPSFLKGEAQLQTQPEINWEHVKISRDLGVEGANFHEIIKYVVQHEKEIYPKFIAFLRHFVPSFHSLLVTNKEILWQFEMTKNPSQLSQFPATAVADGLLKAGAVALLCALTTPPALIMIEEIENSVNIVNLREVLGWLYRVMGRDKQTQFILTSHNPSVIREFGEDLDAIYQVHLHPKTYQSVLTNLNEALYDDVNCGMIDGYVSEKMGKSLVTVKPYQLTELFYSGLLSTY